MTREIAFSRKLSSIAFGVRPTDRALREVFLSAHT